MLLNTRPQKVRFFIIVPHFIFSVLAAKEFINGITLDLEKSLSEGDGTRKLNELYRRIVHSSFEVIAPGRKLLKEGVLLKHSRKEQQSRHLILVRSYKIFYGVGISFHFSSPTFSFVALQSLLVICCEWDIFFGYTIRRRQSMLLAT